MSTFETGLCAFARENASILGEMGIIPGSMGARSFIVRGKGNRESFCSCSHGAGRVSSRTETKRRFTLEDQKRATEGVECRKDKEVIDEIPCLARAVVRLRWRLGPGGLLPRPWPAGGMVLMVAVMFGLSLILCYV